MEYHFDDPTDDTDSADIPKVGYAREFSEPNPKRPDGRTIPVNFIVGSGFYLRPRGHRGSGGACWRIRGRTRFRVGWVRCGAGCATRQWWRSRSRPRRGRSPPYLAAYGMERVDTLETCGDTNNGFVLLVNWNRLGAGEHMSHRLGRWDGTGPGDGAGDDRGGRGRGRVPAGGRGGMCGA